MIVTRPQPLVVGASSRSTVAGSGFARDIPAAAKGVNSPCMPTSFRSGSSVSSPMSPRIITHNLRTSRSPVDSTSSRIPACATDRLAIGS